MKLQIKIIDCVTGEEIIRDATDYETDKMEADQLLIETKQTELEAKAAARQAILDRLGLTEDEAKILLG